MIRLLIVFIGLLWASMLAAQTPPTFVKPGTVVHLQAQAELFADNDEARVTFFVQEQAVDRAEAASVANRKMKETIERIKQADPSAETRTTGYNTYPQYTTNGRTITAWQMRQEVLVVTRNLTNLEKMVARVQSVAAVGGLAFGVSRDLQRKLDTELFDLAFADFRARMTTVAKALGKTDKDVEIEEINLQNSERPWQPRPVAMATRATVADVAEAKFEPGDSRQTLTFTARIRVKP